uniref:PQ-loop repeat-containing protein n=1 Tax=viral metagenome TaxID=1070528 RepID=A0A6C0BWT9_9ZZZZ
MKFELLDSNVPLGMNVMLVIANVINLIYNIPQMVKTYQTKSTRDFSGWFLSLRVIGNAIWLVYSIYLSNLLMLINNVVTVIASVFVGYYKVREMVADYKEKQNKRQITDDDEQMIMELSEV